MQSCQGSVMKEAVVHANTDMEIDKELPRHDQDDFMDNNDTMERLPLEEWVVRELHGFNTSAIANLKVGLVVTHTYETGTMAITNPKPK